MHLRTIIATAAIGLAVTGCSAAESTATSATTGLKQSDKVDALVVTMQRKYPGASRAQILDVANKACEAVDEAGSIVALIADTAADPTVDTETAGDMAYAVGVAVPVLCPKYLPELEALQR